MAGPVTSGTLMGAAEHALWAPSVHNTQPWRWRIDGDTVELHADRTRHLIGTDPDQRELVLSCGAALHHLRAALAGVGVATIVERRPDPESSDLLAVVRPAAGPPDEREAALASAIAARRTDRRALAHPPESAEIRQLAEYATRHGAALYPVIGSVNRARLTALLGEAGTRQRFAEGCPAELAIWTRRYAGARDGIPADLRTQAAAAHGLRAFPPGRLPASPPPRSPEELDALVVLTTPGDDIEDRLRAGEATSAVLLAATNLGLSSTPLSQAIEIERTRHQLAHALPELRGCPQLVIRFGHPLAGAAALPATPRRPLSWVLLPPRERAR